MYGAIVLFLISLLGFRTVSKISNYPYLLLGNYVFSILNRFASSTVLLRIGSIYLYNNDLTILFLLFALLAHKRQFHVRKKNTSIFIYAIMVFYSLTMGLMTFGVNTWIVNDVRKFVYNIVLIIFCAFVDCNINFDRVYLWIKRVAYCVVGYIYIAVILHAATGVQIGTYKDARPLVSHYAITLVIFIIYEVYRQLYKSKFPSISISTYICMVAIIINRYNTTWVAMFLGIMLLILFMPNKQSLINQKFLIQLSIIIVISILALNGISGTAIMNDIISTQDKFSTMQDSDSTFATRTELWGAMLTSLNSKFELLFGKPMGSGYYVNYRGTLWEYDPHNAYVETIMRLGLIGCAAMVFMNIKLIWQAFVAKEKAIIAMIIAIMVYWIAYTYEFELSCVFGFLLHILITKKRSKVE